ncbi:MAG: hypothetical protein KDD82_23170, partial [Planctomycetes bacterium]|nr:hypothetical protein [Planctomycetota bacterium]
APKTPSPELGEPPAAEPAQPAPAVQAQAPEACAPQPAEDEVELCVGPLEVVSETSSLILLRVTPERVERLEVIAKPLVFRALNRGRGPYLYRLLDAQGEPLFSGEFELPELCPLAGHSEPHLQGHVVIEHETVLALRVPALAGATQLEVVRQIPLADKHPFPLGAVALESP